MSDELQPVLGRQTSKPGFAGKIHVWSSQHPVLTILIIAVLAVILNNYPVVFCGRSYVSPACVGPMVYDSPPWLPGAKPSPLANQHGSDTSSTMLYEVPVGFIESRSVLQYGELPLWNRYSHAGDTLIGQAISMLGDPLQWIVILGHGSAVAWDFKFITAKFLFAAGFGLLILRLLGSCGLAFIYTALSAYCGAFFYIYNHPVFFVFVYAPWILLSAIKMLAGPPERSALWGLVWLVANFGCFNAGHIEVGAVLIGGLNLAALIHALLHCRTAGGWMRVLGWMTVATSLFLGLAAPMWISFLASLAGSFTSHQSVSIYQLPVGSLLGAFDDLFYQLLRRDNTVTAVAPGSSLLVLAGFLLSFPAWRQLKADRFFWVNSAAILVWAACIYGGIPASLLAAIPLLNRVGHTHTDFSYLLVIHLTIQSAYGFKCLVELADFRRAVARLLGVIPAVAALTWFYCHGGFGHQVIPWEYFICASLGAVGAPLLLLFFKRGNRRVSLTAWTSIIILGFIPEIRFGLYHTGNDQRIIVPGPRAVLNATSPALNRVMADSADANGPCRVVGFRFNFYGDYAGTYGLEDIRSCAPLSNPDFMHLVAAFPGFWFDNGWVIAVIDPVAAQPLLNLLNIKYVLAPPQFSLPRADFKTVEQSDLTVLENPEIWPRAFFSDRIVLLNSTSEFIPHLARNGKQPFIAIHEAELEKQPGLRSLESTNPAAISPAFNYQLLPNSTAFDVEAPSAGVICLTEGMAKNFTVRVNQESKPVLTVNEAFKGVYLDQPGKYHIEFSYRPPHWQLACTLFWLALVAATSLVLLTWRKTRGRQKNATIAP